MAPRVFTSACALSATFLFPATAFAPSTPAGRGDLFARPGRTPRLISKQAQPKTDGPNGPVRDDVNAERSRLLAEYDSKLQSALDDEWADTSKRYGIDWFFER